MAVAPALDGAGANWSSTEDSSFAVDIDRDLRIIDRAAKRFTSDKKTSARKGAHQSSASSVDTRDEDSAVFKIEGLFQRSVIMGMSVNTLQEWQGYVEENNGAVFTAKLFDLTKPSSETEISTIPISVVDRDDRGKVRPGAIFHLIIGYTRDHKGTCTRKPIVYFRKHSPGSTSIGAHAASLLSGFRDTSRSKARESAD